MSLRFLPGPTLLSLAILFWAAPFFQLLSRLEPDGPWSTLASGPPPVDSCPVSL